MFDLPTDTKPQREAATDFRNFLLDEGFERNLPATGDIQTLNLTDRQYRDIIHFSDRVRQATRKNLEQSLMS